MTHSFLWVTQLVKPSTGPTKLLQGWIVVPWIYKNLSQHIGSKKLSVHLCLCKDLHTISCSQGAVFKKTMFGSCPEGQCSWCWWSLQVRTCRSLKTQEVRCWTAMTASSIWCTFWSKRVLVTVLVFLEICSCWSYSFQYVQRKKHMLWKAIQLRFLPPSYVDETVRSPMPQKNLVVVFVELHQQNEPGEGRQNPAQIIG